MDTKTGFLTQQPPSATSIVRTMFNSSSVIGVIIPYVKSASEGLRRILTKHGVAIHFKPQNTLHSLLVAPKDKTSAHKCSSTVFQISCKDCYSTNVGESGRPLGVRIKEHQRFSSVNSPVNEHVKAGHKIDWDNVKILDKESAWFRRGVN